MNNKHIFNKIKESLSSAFCLIQYWAAASRNYYPYLFVGEKINDQDFYNTLVLYRIKGEKEILEMPIKDVLKNIGLVENFPQKDAIKFGIIAMGDTLFCEKEELMEKKFCEIKKKMLYATCAIHRNFISGCNYYPCVFVGEKNVKEPYNTNILYTINGKREVFELPVKQLLKDPMLLEKFHPTIAVKLGAIAMGDSLFCKGKASKKKFNEVKKYDALNRILI